MTEKFYYEQREYGKQYLIPHLQKYIHNLKDLKILEVGCAEGGFLVELDTLGAKCTGLELNAKRVEVALNKNPNLNILVGDITKNDINKTVNDKYDLIVMREVIEHIPDKETAFNNLSGLLHAGGYLFISFPPKYSPFAGHQQVGRTFLRKIPYIHLLPNILLDILEKYLKENKGYSDHLKLHFETGMSINAFEKYCRKFNFNIVRKDLFFLRPIYRLRFGFPKIKLPDIFFLREFISLGYECVLRKN